MINRILTFLIMFQSLSTAIAQKTLENALLWKITGTKLQQASYLFGTMHLIPTADYFLPNGTKEALATTKSLYLEIDMDDMEDMSALMPIMNKLFMQNDTTLSDLLSKEDMTLVTKHFEEMGLPMVFFEKMKPMFLNAMSSSMMSPDGLEGGQMKSYEMEFVEMAKSLKIPTKGLESIEFQISIFDSIPYGAQAAMLVEGLKSSTGESDELKILTKAYTSQNINQMIETINDKDQSLNPYMDLMVNNRNRNWITIMSKVMSEEPCFFAVGAGHLAGDQGVIRLLRKAGFTVEPVLK